MNVKKPMLVGLMSMAAIMPCKAQRPVEIFSETGITGVINKDGLYYNGVNFGIPTEKNYTDLFAGITLNPDKQVSFLGLVMNNYSWTKNISSWFRGVVGTSKRGTNLTSEVSPVKVNANVRKFNFAFNPAYAMYNDFKDGTTTQGVNTIFQTTYSISPKDRIFAEAKYTSEPAQNLFDTHFGKLKNNISYMVAYMRNF